MKPSSGAVWACAAGTMPGSASAAASSAPRSVAATPAPTDAVAACSAFLAEVDVLDVLRVELVVVELHVGAREILLLPRLCRLDRAAAGAERRQHDCGRERLSIHDSALSDDRAPRGCGPRLRPYARRENRSRRTLPVLAHRRDTSSASPSPATLE